MQEKNQVVRPKPILHARPRWFLALIVVGWAAMAAAIGIPILGGLAPILAHLDPVSRALFWVMPFGLSGALVWGVLQLISIYQYWFGPR